MRLLPNSSDSLAATLREPAGVDYNFYITPSTTVADLKEVCRFVE